MFQYFENFHKFAQQRYFNEMNFLPKIVYFSMFCIFILIYSTVDSSGEAVDVKDSDQAAIGAAYIRLGNIIASNFLYLIPNDSANGFPHNENSKNE